MTLADAIRKGAMQHKQGLCGLFIRRDEEIVETCVLGAAYEGAFGPPAEDEVGPMTTLRSVFPIMRRMVSGPEQQRFCQSCARRAWVETHVIHLNDFHRWTRERIADWLDTLEQP